MMREHEELETAAKKVSTKLVSIWKEIKKAAEEDRNGAQKPVKQLGVQAKLKQLDTLIKAKPPNYAQITTTTDEVVNTLTGFFQLVRRDPNERAFAAAIFDFIKVLQAFSGQVATIQRAHGGKHRDIQQAYVFFKKMDALMETAYNRYEAQVVRAQKATLNDDLDKLSADLAKLQRDFVGMREKRNDALDALMKLENTT